jgi:hypothetical protein
MASWADEAEASFEDARDAVIALQKKDPNHPLLQYWILPPEDRGPDGKAKDLEKEKAVRNEMKDRFWRNSTPWKGQAGAIVVATVYSNYAEALKRAIEGKEGDFEPPPAPLPPKPKAFPDPWDENPACPF